MYKIFDFLSGTFKKYVSKGFHFFKKIQMQNFKLHRKQLSKRRASLKNLQAFWASRIPGLLHWILTESVLGNWPHRSSFQSKAKQAKQSSFWQDVQAWVGDSLGAHLSGSFVTTSLCVCARVSIWSGQLEWSRIENEKAKEREREKKNKYSYLPSPKTISHFRFLFLDDLMHWWRNLMVPKNSCKYPSRIAQSFPSNPNNENQCVDIVWLIHTGTCYRLPERAQRTMT